MAEGKAIVRAAWRIWGVVRQILSIRSLLQWTHWWEPVTAVGVAVGLGIWSTVKHLPGPLTAIIVLLAFVLGLAAWRALSIKTDPTMSASMSAWAGALEPKLIHGRPEVILLYNPNLPGFQLRNTGTVDALHLNLPPQRKDPFLIKWEAEPNMVPAKGDRELRVSAYDLGTGIKLADNPVEIIKTVYADQLKTVDRSSLTLLKGKILRVKFKFSYENFEGARFKNTCRIVFDCLTEQITVRNAA